MTTTQIALGVVGGVAGFFTGGAGWYLVGAVMVGAAAGVAVGTFLDPTQSDRPSPGTAQMQELDIPSIEEGVTIYDVLGTSRAVGQIIWYGKNRSEAIKEKQKSGGKGGGGKSEKVIVGYIFRLSWAQGICLGPVDTLYTVLRDEEVVWSGTLNRPESGGEETITLEGMGSMTFYFGTYDQVANTLIGEVEGTDANPSYRGLCWAYFDDVMIGQYNRAPRMRFIVKKRPAFSFNLSESIGDYDYNPAHAIYYLLTDSRYVEFPTTWINEDSFDSFASEMTGADENHGLSMLLSRADGALKTIESMLTHVGAVMRYGVDGKFHLHSLRANESVASLPEITQDAFLEPMTIERKGWTEVANEVQVQHHLRYLMDTEGELVEGGEFDPGDTFSDAGEVDSQKWVVVFDTADSDTDGSNEPVVSGGELIWNGEKIAEGNGEEGFRVCSLWHLVEDDDETYEIKTRVDFSTLEASGTGDLECFRFGFTNSNVAYATSSYTAIKINADGTIKIRHTSGAVSSSEYTLTEDDFPLWIKVKKFLNLPTWIYFGFSFYKDGVWMNANDDLDEYYEASYETPRNVYGFFEFRTVCDASITSAEVSAGCSVFEAPVHDAMKCWDWSAYDDLFDGTLDDPPNENIWTVVDEGAGTYLDGTGRLRQYVTAVAPQELSSIVRLNRTITGDFHIQLQHGGAGPAGGLDSYVKSGLRVVDTVTGNMFSVNFSYYRKIPDHNLWTEVREYIGGWSTLKALGAQSADFTHQIKRVGGVISGWSRWPDLQWYDMTVESTNPLYIEMYCEIDADATEGPIYASDYKFWFESSDPEPCSMLVPTQALNIRRAAVTGDDRGTAEIHGRAVTRSVQLMMFGTTENANWAADRAIRRAAYPFAEGQIVVNRSAFRYEVGDLFKLSDSEHNITDLVCRVMQIGEGPLDSEKININFMEEPDYATSAASLADITTEGSIRDYGLDALTRMKIIEAPYVVAGDEIKIIPIAGREKGTELGYELWMSIDAGVSYQYVDDITYYAVYGAIATELSEDILTLDKNTSIDIDFDLDGEVSAIETITRTQMFNNENMALIGDEIINFETITPDGVIDDRYAISGLNRSRFDTIRETWPIGTSFWYVGRVAIQTVSSPSFLKGASVKFKMVPYNDKFVGDISEATAIDYTFVGRARAPYMPGNFNAGGRSQRPTYGKNIHLTWDPRVRGLDAGISNPDAVVDSAPTHEGLFEIEVKDSVDSVVRTATGIDAHNWTYTESMNLADNVTLEDNLTFKLDNYIDESGVTYTNIHSSELGLYRVSSTTTTT